MLNEEVADMLCDYRRAKNELKEIRAKMVRFVVEDLGMNQQDATQIDITAFLDGYLVGRGMQQSWRDIAKEDL